MDTETITKRKLSGSKMRTNLLLDIGVFVGFLFAYEPRATGIAAHEWLGMAVGVVLIMHLLLHWEWITGVTRRFFGKLPGRDRLNYALNMVLFAAFTAVLFSGLIQSESILPMVGLQPAGGGFWHWLHAFAADLVLWLVAVHIALHWKWLVGAFRNCIIAPLWPAARRQVKHPAVEAVEVE